MKRFAYLLVASVLLGAHIFAIPLGVAQLSAYRFMIILSAGLFLYKVIIHDVDLEVSFGHQGRISPYQMFYFFWLLYAGISLLWVESISRWIVGIFFVGTGIYSILFISYFIQEELDIKRIFNVFFIMSIFHHISGWIESLSVTFPKTTFGNQNDFATMLLAGIFVGFILFVNTKNIWLKLFLVLYSISGVLLIEVTGSRGNTVGLIVGLVAILAVKLLDLKLSRNIYYLIIGLIILFLVALVLLPSFREDLGEFIIWLSAGRFRPRGSNRNRINMILNGFYFLLKSFGLGVGAGNVEYYLSNEAILYVDAPNIHNWFMDILVGYGIVVFVCYIAMYIFIIRRLFLNYTYSKNHFIRNTSLVLFGYLFAFIISSMSSATNIIIEWQWVFWGMMIAFVQYTEKYAYTYSLTEHDLKTQRYYINRGEHYEIT